MAVLCCLIGKITTEQCTEKIGLFFADIIFVRSQLAGVQSTAH